MEYSYGDIGFPLSSLRLFLASGIGSLAEVRYFIQIPTAVLWTARRLNVYLFVSLMTTDPFYVKQAVAIAVDSHPNGFKINIGHLYTTVSLKNDSCMFPKKTRKH